MNTTMSPLPSSWREAQVFGKQHQPALELGVMLLLYSTLWSNAFKYLFSGKKARAGGYWYHPLMLHIPLSFFLAGRFYVRRLYGAPSMDRLDLAIGLVDVVSVLALIKYSPMTDPLYRGSFHTMALLTLAAAVAGYATASPAWYGALVGCIDWFIYFRMLLGAIFKYRILNFPKVPFQASVHLVSAPLCLWLAAFPGSIAVYYATLISVMALNRWVSRGVPHKDAQRGLIRGGLVWLGFCEAQSLKPYVKEEKSDKAS
ncbi:hypothetical protein VTK73DRAFT_5863 [Phialemonium thermophilum]|uniref:Uncharacterized protein n=1 Tax=Phialemonium thermophilum TaxID=223376 RepID=A0ABR3WM07_9PEZI